MVSLKLMNDNGKIQVKSRDIKDLLLMSEDIEKCQDISDTIKEKDILVFDCQLTKDLFLASKYDTDPIVSSLTEGLEEGYFDMFFEDIRDYIKGFTDEFEEDLQEKYGFDDVRCHFEIYSIGQDFDDFKFILLVAFKRIEIQKLDSIVKIVGRRRLSGASKFYS